MFRYVSLRANVCGSAMEDFSFDDTPPSKFLSVLSSFALFLTLSLSSPAPHPDVGLNHNSINLNNINAVSAVNEKMLGVNPVESCVKKCKEDGKPSGLCKFNCENRHLKRTNQDSKFFSFLFFF